jgi:hypothetical protein
MISIIKLWDGKFVISKYIVTCMNTKEVVWFWHLFNDLRFYKKISTYLFDNNQFAIKSMFF